MIPIQYATFTELSLRGDTPTERQMCRRQMVCRRQTIWATANWATHCGQLVDNILQALQYTTTSSHDAGNRK